MGNNSGILALIGLGVLLALSRGGGISTGATGPGGLHLSRGVPKLAVAFEEYLEENEREIEDYEQRRRASSRARGVAPPIPVLTKAISYRAFLQEKPVKVTTGVYEIR